MTDHTTIQAVIRAARTVTGKNSFPSCDPDMLEEMTDAAPRPQQEMTMSNIQEQEERDFHYDSLADHCRAQAILDNKGCSDRAWLCTDLDVWIQNPSYRGPPVPHPEDDEGIEAYQADPVGWVAREIERRDAAPAGATSLRPAADPSSDDDPIPF